ncbi:hypothetical protein PFISCL1PPCAC_12852, partial [Pristionchus fissidentatus]
FQPTMFELLLQTFTLFSLIASLCFNIILLMLIQLSESRIGNYRKFFFCSIVFDLLYALAECMLSPFYYTSYGICVVAAMSGFSTTEPMIELFWMLWMTLFNDIIIIVAHSVVYRYAVVSRLLFLKDNSAAIY